MKLRSALRPASREWPLLLLPAAAFAAIAPMLLHGPSCGHDFDFHLDNWIEVSRQWQQGIVWPHWDVSANYGAGEPRFVFYPPLSWMLGAGLGLLLGWHAAPLVFLAIALAGGAASMYLLAREYSGRQASALAAALYATNPYALFVVYERAAYAELLAAIWIPLIFLYALREKIDVPRLALAFAFCWLANGPAGVMATYTLALLLLFRLMLERKPAVALRGAAAALLGIAISAFYLLPAATERKWVQIDNAVSADLRPEASFLFHYVGSPEHNVVLRAASWTAVAVFVTLLAAYLLSLRRPPPRPLAPLALLAAVLLLLMLPVSAVAWRYAPELRFLQFPWRFLVVAAVCAALFAAVALARAAGARWLALLLCAASLLVAIPRFQQGCDEEDAVPGQLTALALPDRDQDAKLTGVEGSDEYAPPESDNSTLRPGLPLAWMSRSPDAAPPRSARDSAAGVRVWNTEERRITARAAGPEFLIVRIMHFPAWHVRVEGKDLDDSQLVQRDDGLIAVPVPAGVSRVSLLYREPGDVRTGRIISILALLLLLAISIFPFAQNTFARRLS